MQLIKSAEDKLVINCTLARFECTPNSISDAEAENTMYTQYPNIQLAPVFCCFKDTALLDTGCIMPN